MNNLKLPADCAMMSEDEMMYTEGGNALTIAAKAVVAVGVSGVLLCVAGVAARGILSIFNPAGLNGAISDSVNAGNSFIQNALSSGEAFLNKLMGK